MTKQDAKRARERLQLLELKSAYADFPVGDIEEREAPDFVVACDRDRRVGIELTDYHIDDADGEGSAMRAQERLQDKVTDLALRRYEEEQSPPVNVSIGWSFVELVRPRVEALATNLARAVALFAPKISPGYASVDQTGLPNSPLPDEVAFLHIVRHPEQDDNAWHSPRSGYTAEVPTTAIQERIARKERRLARYRAACSEVWLVIVAEGLAPSSFARMEPAVRMYRYASSFDRVLFFHLFDKTVVPLPLDGPAGARSSL